MRWATATLAQVAMINPRDRGFRSLDDSTKVSFVPMAAVSEATASIIAPTTRILKDVRKGFTSFREGDILWAKITPCMENGKLAIAEHLENGIGFGSTEFHVIRSGPLAQRRYLYFLLRQQSLRDRARARMRGCAGQQRVPADFLAQLEVPLPPLFEQRRIVGILDRADELRRLRTEANTRAERILPALFLKMFGDPATNPMGWPSIRVRDLASKYSDGPFGSNLKSDHYAPSGVRVIRLQNIGVGEFVDADKAYVSEEHFSSLAKHECLPDDVLIGTLGDPNLRACLQPRNLARALNKADCVQLRVRPDVATPEFVCWLLNMPGTLALADELVHGQTRSRISMGRLGELLVPNPPIYLQRSFAMNLRRHEAVRSMHSAAHVKMDSVWHTVLSMAFSGDLTASWREAHMKELLQEMEQQARDLARLREATS